MCASSIASFFRCRQRRFAWLALLAVCLQWLASGISVSHASRQLETPLDFFAVAEICHGNVDATNHPGSGAPLEQSSTDGTHCPFCRIAAAGVTLLTPSEISFPHPEPAAFFVPSVDATLQPSAPDSRHAPKHAPPFSFA